MIIDDDGMADLFGVSTRTVHTWITEGIPSFKENNKRFFEAKQAVDWYVAKKIQKLTANPAGMILDPAQERAALDRARREQIDLALEQKRGEVAPIVALEWALSSACSQIAAVLETIPAKLKRRMPQLTTVDLDIVRKEIAKARNAAAAVKLDFGRR